MANSEELIATIRAFSLIVPLLGLRSPLLAQTRPKSERRDLISSERVTAGRPVNAQVPVGCSGRPSFGRRLARVGTLIRQTSSRLHLLQRHTCPSASRNHCTRACCAVLAGHNACVERRRDASTSTNRERSTASRHADASICAWRHHRRQLIPLPAFTLQALGLCLLWPALSRTRPIRYRC